MPNDLTSRTNQKYSHEDEVAIYVALQLEGGNTEACSRVTGVPASTIRSLKRKWRRDGFSDGDLALVEKVTKDTVGKSYSIILKALDRLEVLIADSTNIGHLVTAIDKLSAHNRLAQGKATVIREERSIDSGVVSDSIVAYLESMAEKTTLRAAEVIDIDPVETSLPVNGNGTSPPKE